LFLNDLKIGWGLAANLAGRATISRLERFIFALDEALTALSQMDAAAAKVVELRYFGGLTEEESDRGPDDFAGHHQTRLGFRQKPSSCAN
jgi:hypothetical protein